QLRKSAFILRLQLLRLAMLGLKGLALFSKIVLASADCGVSFLFAGQDSLLCRARIGLPLLIPFLRPRPRPLDWRLVFTIRVVSFGIIAGVRFRGSVILFRG